MNTCELKEINRELSNYFDNHNNEIVSELKLIFTLPGKNNQSFSEIKAVFKEHLQTKEDWYKLNAIIKSHVIQKSHLSLSGHFLLALGYLVEIENDLCQYKPGEYITHICKLYYILGIIEGACKSLPLRDAFNTIKNNSKKGGIAKSNIYNELKKFALEVMVNNKPSAGYKNIVECVNAIQDDLIARSRQNGRNLSQDNLYQLISKWMRSDANFKSASQAYFKIK